MSHTFDNYRLPELQKYLRERGVTVSGYNKQVLKEIAIAVERLQLPEDPDFLKDSVSTGVSKKCAKLGLSDCAILEIDGYTSDFTHIPDFGLIDIFNYMIFSKADYDGKKLKGYKSFEDYKLFYDGHVESLLFNPMGERQICLFKAQVKPTQRDKTYLNKQFYSMWFALDKEDGFIITAHCECIGGADGACRHIAAALYELEAFERKSCTEGENQWMKRPRHHDIPVPIRNLSVIKAKYGQTQVDAIKPHIDQYDPRHEGQRQSVNEEGKREFGLKLLEVSSNIQALDTLLQPEDRQEDEQDSKDYLTPLSVSEKAKVFVQNHDINITDDNLDEVCTLFSSSLTYTQEEISKIMLNTMGQSSNDLWYAMRKGLLTASNFEKACNYIEKAKDPPPSFLKNIMNENSLDKENLPPPLKWGRRKEPIALLMYHRLVKRRHLKMKTEEKGLLISEEFPFLGCSVDGVSSCRCKPSHEPRLVEIKCPYASKDKLPKEVALEKKCFLEDNQWVVSKECPHYCQIQGQLGLYRYTICDLVIYTRHGIHIATAAFDEQYFTEMVKKLKVFYIKYVVPHLLKEKL